MSNGPGAPISPHEDPDPYEQRRRREPYYPGDASTRPDAVLPGSPPPPAGDGRTRADGTRAGYPGYSGYPGYGREQANAAPAPRIEAPAPLDPLTAPRVARSRRIESGPPEPLKIGIWGSPGSGKSTFLAALQAAIYSSQPSLGGWNLVPLGQQSSKLLSGWTNLLVTDKKFPERTTNETTLSWRFYGDLAGSRFQPPWRRLGRAHEAADFDLDLIDVSGEVFGPRPPVQKEDVDRALRHLADARGLIFLFDPIPGGPARIVEQYLNGPLDEIKRIVAGQGRMVGGRLPHHVCVCVTKFDDKQVFRRACLEGYVNTGRDGIPRVRGRHAKRLFEALCDGTFWPPDELGTPGPQFARRMLQHSFHPARTRYYVTSAIGFKMASDGQFDPGNFANVRQDGEGNRINGAINPINVLEPLVELRMKLRQGRAVR